MPRPATKEPKAPSLGDNLRIHFRDGLTHVSLNTKQLQACREVLHLAQSIGKVQPIEEPLADGADSVAYGLATVIALAGKSDADGQRELPFPEGTGDAATEPPPTDLPPLDVVLPETGVAPEVDVPASDVPPETPPADEPARGRKKRGA